MYIFSIFLQKYREFVSLSFVVRGFAEIRIVNYRTALANRSRLCRDKNCQLSTINYLYESTLSCSLVLPYFYLSCYRSVYTPTFPPTSPVLLLALIRQVINFYERPMPTAVETAFPCRLSVHGFRLSGETARNERETARNAVSTGSPPQSPRTENPEPRTRGPLPLAREGGRRLFGQSFTRGIVTFATADNDNMTVFEYLSRQQFVVRR